MWIMLGFPRHSQKPPTMLLTIHLPDTRRVTYRPDGTRDFSNIENSPLLAWFELNVEDARAHSLRYEELPKYCTFMRGKWHFRKRGTVQEQSGGLKKVGHIGYMLGVHNNFHSRDLFALHCLVTKVKGPKCWEDVRTYEGVVYDTFVDAAFAWGLITDDREADAIMAENFEVLTASELRRLFVQLLVNFGLRDPRSFFRRHERSLLGPGVERGLMGATIEREKQRLLNSLAYLLSLHQTGLSAFGLPEPRLGGRFFRRRRPQFFVEYNFESPDGAEEAIASLNTDQRSAFDAIADSVTEGRGWIVNVDAPGGTGKTFLLNTVAKVLTSRGKKVVCAASSGVAGLLLIGGATLHSKFGVPLNCDDSSHLFIEKETEKARLIRQLDLIIWDEITMFSYHVLDTIDRSLRDLRDVRDRPFGGVTVVLAGDWRQILPVVRNGTGRATVVGLTLKKSSLWSDVRTFNLRRNMRVEGDDPSAEEFRNFLLSVGDGSRNLSVSDDGGYLMPLPRGFVLADKHQPSDLADFVYPDIRERAGESRYPLWLSERSVICGTNHEVATYNEILMQRLAGEARTYISSDEPRMQEGHVGPAPPVSFLNSLDPSGVPPHKLSLKVGSPVTLMRNLDFANGDCNGTRYVIVSLNERSIVCETTLNPRRRVVFYRIKFEVKEDSCPVPFMRYQFPVRPSFAMTANKAQGQTLKTVGVSLLRSFFSHGQLYVALSRVRDRDGLRVLLPFHEETENSGDPVIDNVVFTEVLNRVAES